VAQLGPPDMRVPIANCLAWPERMSGAARLDLAHSALTFEPPDPLRFPALSLARQALVARNGAPTVLNAANEIAVQEFIQGRLGFAGIAALVEATMETAVGRGVMREPVDVDDAIAIDQAARSLAKSLLPEITLEAV
jgi:1-deoxy-D-xylulose-5-phosphate reductoisomerase